ncbi:MAG: SwmB domain-containing protein, partial [Rhodospirillaceae bacterium]|nr:SwmB domain-containing protein [Rhodospirillaceae bacterium]
MATGTGGGCDGCPHAPTGYVVAGPGSGQLTVHWTPAATGPVARWWNIRWSPHIGQRSGVNYLASDRRSYTISGFTVGTRYDISVYGFGEGGIIEEGGDARASNVEVLDIRANAGPDVTVRAGARVVLDGRSSILPLSSPTYAWTQTRGPTVTLDDATSATPAFIAPSVTSSTPLTFSLAVGDAMNPPTDTVTVTVLPSRVKSAKVDGDELSVTFDTALDATSKPAGSAFTVTARKAGSSRTIAGTAASVAISGRTVTATLSAAVAADERLTVRYDKPASGAVLQDGGGNALPSFADRPAGNVGGDTTGPAFVSAQANGTQVTITFDEALDETVAAAPGEFFRIVGNFTVSAREVSISGRTVTATFVGAVKHDDDVKVNYQHSTDTTKRLKDLSGNEAPEFRGVTNRKTATNVTPPTYQSASVNGNTLTVTFDGGLDTASVPAASAFTVKATRSGTERAVALAATTPVAVSGTTVTLTLAEAVLPVAVDTA